MAGIGPFPSFAFPGVYTQTLNEAPQVSAAGALRVPAFIGVADEVIPITAYEMVRGSSSMADNKITLENVSLQVTGTNRNFTTSFSPLVTGTGNGIVTTNPNDVAAYVNGDKVPVATVDGTNGIVYLMSFPAIGDVVQVSYYFKRKDTHIVNEDLSLQADGVNKVFKVDNVPIVTGNNGGVTSTDPTTVSVTVGGSPATVTALDGGSGMITLSAAPGLGATVLATYYTNTYQDTYDILPSDRVVSITKIGYSSTTQDFVNNADYVLDSTGTFNTINWGNSAKESYGSHTVGFDYFYDQISNTLFDNQVYRRPATGTSDGTRTTFSLAFIPTVGNGLGKPTDATSLVSAYVGANPTVATSVQVLELSGKNQTITLKNAPTAGQNVYVTQYENMLTDDVWTMPVVVAGAVGTGSYSVSGTNSGIGYNVTWSASDTTIANGFKLLIAYPTGQGSNQSDAQVAPGYGVNETVTLTFSDSTKYIVTSDVGTGSGSSGDNTGYLGQTYIDKKTFFRVTIMSDPAEIYTAGDKIGYKSSSTIVTNAGVTQPGYTRAIPGLKLFVTDTVGVDVGNSAVITTYNKSGSEPNIGDFYYVSFLESKEFKDTGLTEAVFVTLEKDAIAFTGPLAITNKLGLAAHLAFLNGAPAMALLQLQKTAGGTDAPDSEYIAGIDYFNSPMAGGVRPSLMEPVTTSLSVLTYLKTSNTIQSSIRYANERMSYFGFANNTSPSTVQTYASAMNSERMIGIYPDGAITTLTDDLGNNVDYLVDGSLLAAAISGRDTSPAYDVAEPLVRKPVVGFTRLFRRMDPVTQAQVANSGITLLEEQAAGIVVKTAFTTDLTSVLTREPSVIRIKDYVQKGTRAALLPYIGMKYLPSRTGEIETTLNSYLSSLVKAKIITAFKGVKATPDPTEATTINVEAFYSPVLPLLWIVVTYNLRSSM